MNADREARLIRDKIAADLHHQHELDQERAATGRPTSNDWTVDYDPGSLHWVRKSSREQELEDELEQAARKGDDDAYEHALEEIHHWRDGEHDEDPDDTDERVAQPAFLPEGLFDLEAFRQETLPPRTWLENGIFEFGPVVNKLTSASGIGKSLLLALCAVLWSLGRSALDVNEDGKPRQLDRPLRVLYIDGELGPRWWHAFLQKTRAPMSLPNFLLYTLDDNPRRPTWPALSTPEGARALLQFIARCGDLDVIVFDTLSALVGGEESDNDTWLTFDRLFTLPLKAAGYCVIYADHTGHDGTRARGGSAKKAKLDIEWVMDAPERSDRNLLRLSNDPVKGKMRDGFDGYPTEVFLRRSDNPLTHTRISAAVAATAGTYEDPRVQAVIADLDRMNLPDKTGRPTALARLKAAGITARTDDVADAVKYRQLRASASDAATFATDHAEPEKGFHLLKMPVNPAIAERGDQS